MGRKQRNKQMIKQLEKQLDSQLTGRERPGEGVCVESMLCHRKYLLLSLYACLIVIVKTNPDHFIDRFAFRPTGAAMRCDQHDDDDEDDDDDHDDGGDADHDCAQGVSCTNTDQVWLDAVPWVAALEILRFQCKTFTETVLLLEEKRLLCAALPDREASFFSLMGSTESMLMDGVETTPLSGPLLKQYADLNNRCRLMRLPEAFLNERSECDVADPTPDVVSLGQSRFVIWIHPAMRQWPLLQNARDIISCMMPR